MTRQQVISHFGNITKACDALGYTRYAVYKWRKGIPLRTQHAIESMSCGALKAQIRKSK